MIKWLASVPTASMNAGAQEAHLIALACSAPLEGQSQWSLRLLADELVRQEVADTISYETVRQTLKNTSSSRI